MTETLKGFVQIEPKAWKRPGQRKGGRYNASKADEQAFLVVCVFAIGRPENLPEGDVCLSATFVCPVKRGRKPDLANLIKLIEDAMEGVYYKNDGQINKYGSMERAFTKDNDKVGTHIEIIYSGE